MPDEPHPDNPMADLMRRIDDLLGEAAELRDQAVSAGRARADHPFWPDRRRTNTPYEPDRRTRYR